MEEYMIDISSESGLPPGKLYLLQIAKSSIDKMSFDFIDKCLSHLHDQGSKTFGTVITMIDGYGDVADDIYAIPEIRNWTKALVRKYPYILYFINHSLDSHINLLSCIGDIALGYVGEANLTPEEYIRRGINPLTDVTPRKWVITLSDDIYEIMETSLIH
ncbi:hypothetical protein [Paenibacillus sp. Y412MC10]|uniref:hypothetical protein n=1 Tax=Geobacillus sp. (strain Y412MC10) TaxID=481743 RepID=UPI0011AB5BDD|nr:hypothetical protein [Paenibacillus sp. Y412MC10]